MTTKHKSDELISVPAPAPKECFNLSITSEVDKGNGTHTIYFEIDDKLKKQFMKNQGLKRWSQKRFEKVFIRGARRIHAGARRWKEMRSQASMSLLNDTAMWPSDFSLDNRCCACYAVA